tara:strand:- start:82 stop:360 length:279 start_codon:yes stop_codon:yes gene_type:complete
MYSRKQHYSWIGDPSNLHQFTVDEQDSFLDELRGCAGYECVEHEYEREVFRPAVRERPVPQKVYVMPATPNFAKRFREPKAHTTLLGNSAVL